MAGGWDQRARGRRASAAFDACPSRSASTPTKLPSRTTATTPGMSRTSASRSEVSRPAGPGRGIGGLVGAASPAPDRDVRLGIESALAAIEAIPTPYTQALLEQRPEIAEAYARVQDLRHLLTTEVLATLGGLVSRVDLMRLADPKAAK